MRNLWRQSIAFRRVVSFLTLALAAYAFYLASNIPLVATLPSKDVDNLAMVHTDEELRLYGPRADPGDLLLSFQGAFNVGAEVWAQQATLTGSSVSFAALAPPGPSRAVYAVDGPPLKSTGKDCRTSLKITRGENTGVSQQLKLWQQGSDGLDQRLRRVILTAPETALNVEVSTDSSDNAPCPRLLTMGTSPIRIPLGPVYLLVPPNQPITIIFSAINPDQVLWPGKADTFDDLSFGDGDLKADSLDILSHIKPETPLLHVAAHKGTDGITLHDLALGTETITFAVGEDRERADAWANGKKFPVLNLVEQINKNPILSTVIAGFLVSGLFKWIQKNCFRNQDRPPASLPSAEP